MIAVVGLYAVSACIADRRQREAALRMALGAARESVAFLHVRGGVAAVALGLVAGWFVTTPIANLLAGELRGVAAADVPTRLR
jgi:hypothetical protein